MHENIIHDPYLQQVNQEANNLETPENAKQVERLDITTLPTDSNKVNRLSKEAI